MIKKIAFTCLGLALITTTAFAGNDEGEDKGKDDPKKSEEVSSSDSTKLLEIDIIEFDSDDTLVFEDWEIPKEKSGGIKENSGSNGNSGLGASSKIQPNKVVSNAGSEQSNKYEVSFEIYPNPTANMLNVRAETEPNSILIYNLQGELVGDFQNQTTLDVSEFASGTYLIRLVYGKHIETRKFVKSL